MENSSNTLFSRLAKLGKKKPQPLTDFSDIYAKIANESIYFLKLEERGHYKQAIQGWKAMCTNVMFQLTMVERQYPNIARYTQEEVDVRDGITELYQKGLINLERVKKLYEEFGDKVDEDNLTFTDVTHRRRINSPMKPITNNFAPPNGDMKTRKKFTSLRDQEPQRNDNLRADYNNGGNVFNPSGSHHTNSLDSEKHTKVYFATSKPLGKPKLNENKSAVADYFDDFDDEGEYSEDSYEDTIGDLIDLHSDDEVEKDNKTKINIPQEPKQSSKALDDIARMNRRISKHLSVSGNGEEDFAFDVDDYFADDYSDESDIEPDDEAKARLDALSRLSGKDDAASSVSATSSSSNVSVIKQKLTPVEVPLVPPPLPPLPSLSNNSEKDIWNTSKPYILKNNISAPVLSSTSNAMNGSSNTSEKSDSLRSNIKKQAKSTNSAVPSKPVIKKEIQQEKPQIKIENYIDSAKSQPISAAAVAKLVYNKRTENTPQAPKMTTGKKITQRPSKPMTKSVKSSSTKAVPVVKRPAPTRAKTEAKQPVIYKTKPVSKSTTSVNSRPTGSSTSVNSKVATSKPKKLVKRPVASKTTTAKSVPAVGKNKETVTKKKVVKPNDGIKKTTSEQNGPTSPQEKSGDETTDEKKLKEALEDEIIDSLPGVDKTAAKQIFSEIVVHGDEVRWEDIAGLENAKFSLKEAVVYPFLRPDLFLGLREPVRGMLLFGPPGTGKTMLARAVATESHSTFFSISASSLTSKYLGESEKLVRALFAIAKKLSPSIIFVDEIDSIMGSRNSDGENESSRRIKNEFLIQWSSLSSAAAGNAREDGDDGRVLVLAATNLPWSIDEAARRRFVRRQYIPLPEPATRQVQLKKLLSHQKHNITDADFEQLLNLTEGYSGSDITSLAKDAAMGPLRELGDKLLETTRESIRPIELIDFKNSLEYIKPSVSQEGLQQYEEWAAKFGSSGV
ncbi:Uncharacterized protein RNJ44_04856 [Nakaseomyces bracarensis]|uniref:AAA+ ATPase domain-containing protein n=1 Tax=Nakaseomyces bracarensis TaxID=273131 RepID=A0ABR4NW65_9SACH